MSAQSASPPPFPPSPRGHTTFSSSNERSASPAATRQNQRQTIHFRNGSQPSSPIYNPYSSYPPQNETDILKSSDDSRVASTFSSAPTTKKRSRGGPFLNIYMAFSGMFGFRERYTLMWFFIFGGALLGFCLARSEGLVLSKLKAKMTTAGEFYWYDRSLFRVNYQIHVILTTVGGILVGGQFVPAIRRNFVLVHRINGYTVLALLIVGNICGGIISYKSFGGELSVQVAYYLMAVMLIVAGCLGYANVKKQTRSHRKWMLRMVTYFSTVITARLISLSARQIISRVGTYYSVWRCDEIRYILQDAIVQTIHPECFPRDAHPGHYSVAVLATTMWGDKSDPIHKLYAASATRVCQGTALWLGLLINVVGVEIYLSLTDNANYTRYGYELKPKDYDEDGREPWVYR